MLPIPDISTNLEAGIALVRSNQYLCFFIFNYIVGCMSSDAPPLDPFISQAEAGKLLNSLLKLRQACCHPQVGSSGLRSLQQSPMTMEEILSVGVFV